MKQILSLLIAFITVFTAFSQVPQGISYQGVARDAEGNVLSGKTISVRVSIIDNAQDGSVVYQESQTVATNKLGLFTLPVGRGTATRGAFEQINWSMGNKFLKVEIDENGGTAYKDMGATELLSVPYALHSGTADLAAKIGSSARAVADSAWLLTGNLGTNSTVNFIGTRDLEDLVIRTNNVERVRIKSAGYVGINNNNASAFLEVFGSATIPAFKAGDGSNYAQFSNGGDLTFKAGADYLVGPNRYAFRYQLNEDYGLFFNASNTRYEFRSVGNAIMTSIHANNGNIYTPGNVGIAEWNPVAKLHVNGNAVIGDQPNGNYAEYGANGSLRFVGTADYLVGGNRYAFRYLANPNFGIFFNATGARYEFHNATATRVFSVNANTGEVYFTGALSPAGISGTAGQVLQSQGPGLPPIWGTVAPGGPDDDWAGQGTGSMYTYYLTDNVGIGTMTPTHKLEVNGLIKTFGTNEISDQRFKKNIVTVKDALQKVMELRGVNYEWRTDEFEGRGWSEGLQLGLIAQEVEKIVPEIVHTDREGFKSVNYSTLVALLIEALKDQQGEIDRLTAKSNEIDVLRSELNTIKAMITGMEDRAGK